MPTDEAEEIIQPPVVARFAALKRLERVALVNEIAQLDRRAFRELLADFMHSEPTPEALQAFADRSPDRWMQAITQAAKLAGYPELDRAAPAAATVNINIAQASDADLVQLIAHTMAGLGVDDAAIGAALEALTNGRTIEGELVAESIESLV